MFKEIALQQQGLDGGFARMTAWHAVLDRILQQQMEVVGEAVKIALADMSVRSNMLKHIVPHSSIVLG